MLDIFVKSLSAKSDFIVGAKSFTADLPTMTILAWGQLIRKLGVDGIKLTPKLFFMLNGATRNEVVRQIGAYLGDDHKWMVRFDGDICVAILSTNYTPISHLQVALAIEGTGLKVLNIFPLQADAYTENVQFRLSDPTKGYTLGDGAKCYLGVLVRNSEVGTGALAVDIGVVKEDGTAMWSKHEASVESRVIHWHHDPTAVARFLNEVLEEAPSIAETHVRYINALHDTEFLDWDALKKLPVHVVEEVHAQDAITCGQVYEAICFAARRIENDERRREVERVAFSIVSPDMKPVQLRLNLAVCPTCGKEVD